ncbi:hypothetical protein CVT24_011260 [Panaeolus cyanescens]|uniref:Uncharacterized protein n=1 Tax=Panaeolus cyanescens TaxID=181874 RepID=A0A409VI46_9AGAR|nr:hypothetical protein CVT24_011260 [Panaeolus cyanescens]
MLQSANQPMCREENDITGGSVFGEEQLPAFIREGIAADNITEKTRILFSDLPEDIYEVFVGFLAASDEQDAEVQSESRVNDFDPPMEYGVGRRHLYTYPSLLACSLVGCRALLPLCRRHIFRVVEVWKTRPVDDGCSEKSLQHGKLEDLLDMSPHIGNYIRDVIWVLEKYSRDELNTCLLRLPKLRSVTLQGRVNPMTDINTMPNTLAILQRLTALPSLSSITIKDVQNAFVLPLMTQPAHLRALKLDRVTLNTSDPIWTRFEGYRTRNSSTTSIESLAMSRPIDSTSTLVPFESILAASQKLRSMHLYWKNEGFYFPTLASWDADFQNHRVALELGAVMHNCGQTLQHLKLSLFYHPRNTIFIELGNMLTNISDKNIVETLDISVPYPGNEGGGFLPLVPRSSWARLDSALSSFPFLRRLSIKVIFYTWAEYTAYPQRLMQQCWKHYEQDLVRLTSSTDITFSFTVHLECEAGERARYRELSSTKVTGPSCRYPAHRFA